MSDQATTFYYAGMSSLQPDGALLMRVTGWEGGTHWSGQQRFLPDDPDLKFWLALGDRMRAHPDTVSDFVSEEQLPALREQFRARGRITYPVALNKALQRTATGGWLSRVLRALLRR